VRILIATGGSPHSEAALRFGATIAQFAGEPLTVMTVIRSASERPAADRLLAGARDRLAQVVPKVETCIRVGQPAQQIVTEASAGQYDLVVVGERPAHTLWARFLGSTATEVVERAPCPVIIAKGKIGPVRRILLCDSGAESPSVLTRFTAQLADMLGGEEEITVLHVMSQITAWPGVQDDQLDDTAEELMSKHAPEGEWLTSDLQVLAHPGIHAVPKVRHGGVVEEILTEVEAGNYDLIVIGAHRGEGWQRFLLEDIAHNIMTRVNRPVLVVR
jgi:nucleotide-binding universal stress UspA family protein